MTQVNGEDKPTKGKGRAFFDRADQVAETGNWDFAIEMYVEGIKREPDDIERGHKPLRKVSMNRLAQGGKKAGMMEVLKRRPGKDPVENLANAEYLLAKEPGNVQHMVAVLKAATALELPGVVTWIGDIILEAQRQAKRPNMQILKLLTSELAKSENYASAIAACDMAIKLNPNDTSLQNALRELGAKYTLQKGKYGQEGDFVKGVKNMDEQKKLIEKDKLSQGRAYLEQNIEQARKEYLANPNISGKIASVVDALLKIEEEGYENEAIDILTKAYQDSKAYQYKMRIGDIKIKQMTRRYRNLLAAGDKQAALQSAREQLEFELKEYADRAVNYPTDLSIKFELGKRQLIAKKYDDAIASLQQAQRDPRRHVRAMKLLGEAFAAKQWYREAAETFEKVLGAEMSEENKKEVQYDLGDVLEKLGDLEKARNMFSEVAQIDFNYRDVRNRLEDLRKKLDSGS